jgi:hypothetical protein
MVKERMGMGERQEANARSCTRGFLLGILLCLLSAVSFAEGPWNGKACAFTFSADDGNACCMDWKQVYDDLGLHYTLFIVPSWIDTYSSKLTSEEVNQLHDSGHEIASHSETHPPMITDEAFVIFYVGQAIACSLEITADSLILNSSNDSEDRAYSLRDDPSTVYMWQLSDCLSQLEFMVTEYRSYHSWHNVFKSDYLALLEPTDIRNGDCLVRTTKGLSADSLLFELRESAASLVSMIEDTEYVCRTFTYPEHLHDVREMCYLRDSTSYIASRDGGKWGNRPVGCNPCQSRWSCVTLYEVPLAEIMCNLVGDSCSATEEETRQAVRSCLELWKGDQMWANIYCHKTYGAHSCDTLHMRWILEEIIADGDVWVATFGEVAEYVRETHWSRDGLTWYPKPDVRERRTIPLLCGDANGEGILTTSDGFTILNYFGAGSPPQSCWSANVNGDDAVTPADGYFIFNHLGSDYDLRCEECEF